MYSTSQFGLTTFQAAQAATGYCIGQCNSRTCIHYLAYTLSLCVTDHLISMCPVSPGRFKVPCVRVLTFSSLYLPWHLKAVRHTHKALQARLLMGVSAGD